jgi:hypothetical protein
MSVGGFIKSSFKALFVVAMILIAIAIVFAYFVGVVFTNNVKLEAKRQHGDILSYINSDIKILTNANPWSPLSMIDVIKVLSDNPNVLR